jgi:drug/metabolite transporter (DMT)-like permease
MFGLNDVAECRRSIACGVATFVRMSRSSLITTAEGSTTGAFTSQDWGVLAVVSVVWGSSFLFIANGLESFHPATIGLLRITLGMVTLRLVPAARRVHIDRADRTRLMLLGALWMAAPFTLYPLAEQWVSSSVAGMLNGGMPLLVAVVASLMLRRRPGRSQLIGLCIGFAGIVAIGLPSLRESSAQGKGIAMIVGALLCYSISINLAVPMTQKYGSLAVQLRVQTYGVVFAAPYGIYGLRHVHPKVGAVLSILALGVLGTGLAFVLAGRLMARVGATRGSVFTYVMPVVALALGVWFRNESVHGLAIAGCAFVLLGAFITSRAGR